MILGPTEPQRRYRFSRCPAVPKEKASKAHSSQGRHRRVESRHKWATEEQFALIVVIIGDQGTLAEQLAKLPVVIFGD